MSVRIAYMTGEYLRISPFVFVFRELSVLRDLGVHVETISVRGVSDADIVTPEQAAERESTFVLLPFNPFALLGAHARLFLTSPVHYWRAIRLAAETRAPGMKACMRQMAYFLEAGLVANRMRIRKLQHLHNHLGDSSCTVAMLAAELGGFTFSFTLHGPGIWFEPHRWRLDAKLGRARFVSCISHFCRSQAMISTPVDRWDRLHIVHCGVDPDLYAPIQHTETHKRLVFVGRLANVKGVPLLLEAVNALRERHPEVELVLVGDGPDRPALESQARRLGIETRVTFAGYQSQEQIRTYLSEADVFVMASFAEGVPVVLMEAMATGLPVVATRIAGTAELVEDGVSGYITPPGDLQSLVARADELLGDVALRQRMGEAGRRKVEADFDIRKEGAKLHEILRQELPET